MEKIINQTHNKETYLFALSRLFERASYYGIRALLVLYLVDKSGMNMSRSDANSIYGWVVGFLVLAKIIGGILGDLVIGNKNSIIIGGLLQAIGAFCLSIVPSSIGVYTGLTFIIIGGGLYSPNMIANFGKLYSNKTKLLDAGFTIFLSAVSIGALIGPLILGRIGEFYRYEYGIAGAGLLMLFSIIFPFFYMEKESNISANINTNIKINNRLKRIVTFLFFVAIYWTVYKISKIGAMEIGMKLSAEKIIDISNNSWLMFEPIFLFAFGIFMAIIWTFYYSNRFIKLLIGFMFGTLSFSILFLIPETITKVSLIYYLISLLFLGISETYIVPIILSVLTKYSNPKYLAIIISLAFIPTQLFSIIFHSFDDKFYHNPMFALKFGTIIFLILTIGLLGYMIKYRKHYLQ